MALNWRQDAGLPAVAVTVCRRGLPIAAVAEGRLALEHASLASTSSLFQLGSVAKHFASTLALQLVQDGLIGLDDSLASLLPEVPPAWDRVSIRHLLCHRSGLPDYDNNPRARMDVSQEMTDREFLRLVGQMPLLFAPGTRSSYSNTGYAVLGIAISRLLGRHWSLALRERVLTPLGLRATRIASGVEIVENRAQGHCRLQSGVVTQQPQVSSWFSSTADGALYTSAEDLVRWSQLFETETVLPLARISQLWEVASLPDGTRPLCAFGLGVSSTHLHGDLCAYFAGWWQGFKAGQIYLPRSHLYIAAMANGDWADPLDFCRKVAAALEPRLIATQPVADSAPQTTRKVAEWLADTVDPAAVESQRGPNGKVVLTAAQRQELREWLGTPLYLDTLRLCAESRDGTDRYRTYRLEYAVGFTREAMYFRVGLDHRSQVISFET
jgi:CubicO group peptidase (beta-lactamase class C family)